MDKGLQKLIDTAGAGASLTSPGWLTQLGRLWGGKSVRQQCRLCTVLACIRAICWTLWSTLQQQVLQGGEG